MTGLEIGLSVALAVTLAAFVILENEREKMASRLALMTFPGKWMRATEVAERARFLSVNTAYAALRSLAVQGLVEVREVPGGPECAGRSANVYRARS